MAKPIAHTDDGSEIAIYMHKQRRRASWLNLTFWSALGLLSVAYLLVNLRGCYCLIAH